MEIKYTDRTQLKEYFRKNKIPKETDFSEFIDASLNQREDGLVKMPGDPLSIEAVGEKTSVQKLMNFYRKLSDPAPTWSFNLNDQNSTGGLLLGLNIISQGKGRLFIDEVSGRVGLATSEPQKQLHIESGELRVRAGHNNATSDIGTFYAQNLTQGIGIGYNKIEAIGSNADQDIILLPKGNGSLQLSGNVSVTSSVYFGTQMRQMINLLAAGYGIGIQGSTLYQRTDKNFSWYIGGTHADGELTPGAGGRAAMVLKNGLLGIGTANPKDLTHVAGNFILGLEGNNQKFIFHPRTNASGDFLQITHDNGNGDWNWGNGITLQRGTGNVGISIVTPQKKLHVETGEFRVRASHNEITPDIGAFYAQNLTQGIGIGYNRIEAIGSNPDQNIVISPKGNGVILFKDKTPLTFRRFANRGDNLNLNTGVSVADYTAAIVGFIAAGGDIDEGGASGVAIIQVYMYISGGTWWIRADFKTHNVGENWTVDVMFAANALCSREGY